MAVSGAGDDDDGGNTDGDNDDAYLCRAVLWAVRPAALTGAAPPPAAEHRRLPRRERLPQVI